MMEVLLSYIDIQWMVWYNMRKTITKYNKKNEKIIRTRIIIKEVNNMATQIAATPIVYGAEAKKIMRESKTKQSRKAEENARKLLNFFNRITS